MNLRLARNALSNLAGAVIPALVALVTVPLVVKGLGEAGYGLYSLVTAIVGYFAVIDINVTAGSVKYIAQFNASGERERINQTFTFGVLIYAGLGLLGATMLFLGAGTLTTRLFTVPPALHEEMIATLRLAALGFFLAQLQSYLQSVPQALMRYDIAGRIEVLFGVLVPLMTVLVLLFGYGLFEVILVRVVASALNCLLLWQTIGNLLPELSWRRPDGQLRRALLGFSAYSFFSRFAALSYAHADKLIVGALAGVTALAFYTVAATLANRILSLTYRLSSVFFPAASSLAASGQHALLDRLYLKANRYIVFINASVLVLAAVFAYPILQYWMSPEFARQGALALALLATSQFVDSLTNLPALVNDGMGHPRVTGLFALARAVLGLGAIYLGVRWFGIDGAAWGHLLTAAVLTAAFLAVVHGRTVPSRLGDLAVRAYLPTLLGVGPVALAAALARPLAGGHDLALLLLTALLLAASGVLFILDKDDRVLAWSKAKGLLRGRGECATGAQGRPGGPE